MNILLINDVEVKNVRVKGYFQSFCTEWSYIHKRLRYSKIFFINNLDSSMVHISGSASKIDGPMDPVHTAVGFWDPVDSKDLQDSEDSQGSQHSQGSQDSQNCSELVDLVDLWTLRTLWTKWTLWTLRTLKTVWPQSILKPLKTIRVIVDFSKQEIMSPF